MATVDKDIPKKGRGFRVLIYALKVLSVALLYPFIRYSEVSVAALVAGIVLGSLFYRKAKDFLKRLDGAAFGIFEGVKAAEDIEEDFMNTKKGKLFSIICVMLVLYMFASAFCIYKLNAKINSLYEITQELKQDR